MNEGLSPERRKAVVAFFLLMGICAFYLIVNIKRSLLSCCRLKKVNTICMGIMQSWVSNFISLAHKYVYKHFLLTAFLYIQAALSLSTFTTPNIIMRIQPNTVLYMYANFFHPICTRGGTRIAGASLKIIAHELSPTTSLILLNLRRKY